MAPRSSTCLTASEFERKYVRPAPGKVLVVGSRVYATRTDRRKLYVDAVGVDMLEGEGVDCVCNLENDVPYFLGPFSHIDCISVLEHSEKPWALAHNLELLLHPGNTLFVEAPFIWRVHAYPNDFWRFTIEAIKLLFPSIQWAALEYVPARKSKAESLWLGDKLYFQRTEVCGFGRKK